MHGKPSGPCANCGNREATHWFSHCGCWLAVSHDDVHPWCERCILENQIEVARGRAAALPELEAQLDALRKATP